MEMASHEWLWMQQTDFYQQKMFKLVSRGVIYINVLVDYVEKQSYLSEINDIQFLWMS
jgi:hypothetical protein